MSEIGSAASDDKSFENVNGRTHGRTDAQTEDGRKVITIAHPEQSPGELKNNDFPCLVHADKILHLSWGTPFPTNLHVCTATTQIAAMHLLTLNVIGKSLPQLLC